MTGMESALTFFYEYQLKLTDRHFMTIHEVIIKRLIEEYRNEHIFRLASLQNMEVRSVL